MEAKDVFLSYSHHDVELARKVAALLAAYGYSIWWDHQLQAGEDFRATIAGRIGQCLTVVVLFTEHSVQSGWVLDEAGRGNHLKKLVPVVVGDVEAPLGFGSLHYCRMTIDSAKPDSEEAASLIGAVQHVSGHAPGAFSKETYESALSMLLPSPVKQQSRFYVGWFPGKALLRQIVTIAGVYFIALCIAFVVHPHDYSAAFREWVKLLHVYSGMLVFGGGIFLFSFFRISDNQPTREERAAAGDFVGPVLTGWRIAALTQLVTGALLIYLSAHYTVHDEWIVQSFMTYLSALYLWWRGFRSGLQAVESEAFYRDRILIRDFRASRDLQLTLALVFTAWTLTLMVFKNDANLAHVIGELVA